MHNLTQNEADYLTADLLDANLIQHTDTTTVSNLIEVFYNEGLTLSAIADSLDDRGLIMHTGEFTKDRVRSDVRHSIETSLSAVKLDGEAGFTASELIIGLGIICAAIIGVIVAIIAAHFIAKFW